METTGVNDIQEIIEGLAKLVLEVVNSEVMEDISIGKNN